MGHDWILDVLADLKTYARTNGMPSLAQQLDDTALVAQVEMASGLERNEIGPRGTHTAAGRAARAFGIS